MSDYNNRMTSRGKFIASSSSSLETEVNIHLQASNSIECEVNLLPLYKNNASGQVEVIQIEYPSVFLNPDNDTYIKNTIPFFSYYEMASLANGEISGEKYESFMTFNGLTKLEPKVTRKIAEAKLVIFKSESTDTNINIELFDLNETFKESNISYLSHPNCRRKLVNSNYNKNLKAYEFDITKYVREVAKLEEIHTGFGFKSDKPFVLQSNNSANKPYIQIRYIPDDMFGSSSYMPSEVDILKVSSIDVECKFDDQYPKLDVECIISKESVETSVEMKMQNNIAAEVSVRAPDQFNSIETECIFSKEDIEANMFLASLKEIDAEMVLYKPENDFIETELNLITVSHRPVESMLAFSDKIEAEVSVIPKCTSELECECNISKPEIDIETDIIPLYSNYIDSEINLIKLNNESELDVECIISKDSTEIILDIRPVSIMDVEANIIFEKYMDVECIYKVTDNEHIECETDLKLYSNLDIETKIITNDTSSIDVESNILLSGNSDINAEADIIFIGNSYTEVEADIIFENYMDAEVLYLESGNSKMDIEANVVFIGESDMDVEADIIFENYMDVETDLVINSESSLDTEVILYKDGSVPMDCECKYVCEDVSEMYTELNLLVNEKTDIQTEFNLLINMENTIDVQVDVTLVNNCGTLIIIEN